MAIYYSLPAYKVSYDLLIELFKLTKNFPREFKYTIGENIQKETIEMIIGIYRANSNKDKAKYIASSRENLEVIRLLLRLLKDLKQISLNRYVQINEKIENLSKQLTSWQKYQDKHES